MRRPTLNPLAALALLVVTFLAYGLVIEFVGRDATAVKFVVGVGTALWADYVHQDAKRHGRGGWWWVLTAATGGLAAPLYCWSRDLRRPRVVLAGVADRSTEERLP